METKGLGAAKPLLARGVLFGLDVQPGQGVALPLQKTRRTEGAVSRLRE